MFQLLTLELSMIEVRYSYQEKSKRKVYKKYILSAKQALFRS